MDPYIVPQADLPDRLYRVQYGSSKTKTAEDESLVAADRTTVYTANEVEEFRKAIEKHFTWNHSKNESFSSPFISLFSDQDFAVSWAQKVRWDDWTLYVIDTVRLRGSRLFKLSQLTDELNASIPQKASIHFPGAFICLHRVPKAAIVERVGPERALKRKYRSKLSRARL